LFFGGFISRLRNPARFSGDEDRWRIGSARLCEERKGRSAFARADRGPVVTTMGLSLMRPLSTSSLPGLTRQSMVTSRMRTYWIYILASRPRGTLYVGMTNNLIRRVYEHREGLAGSFTNEHGVKMLVYYEQHATAIAAIQREKNIKHWSRKWKIDLIRTMNPDWIDLWEDIVR
jgi:putative endonuclease